MGIVAMQIFLLLVHGFVYHTWIVLMGAMLPVSAGALRAAMLVAALSFIPATLLAFRWQGAAIRVFYTAASIWLGFLNFFFWAACLAWIFSPFLRQSERPWLCAGLALVAVLTGCYGLGNAYWIRVRRLTVALPNLPEAWRGRRAVLASDVHLGAINGLHFSRRLARKVARLAPEMVFIPGDLFDGGEVDGERLLAPFRDLAVPRGIYFSSGNHDEFGDHAAYRRAIENTGIRVLANESVEVDGVAILGVCYGDSTSPLHLRAILETMRPRTGQPAILLNHVPNRLPIVEEAGVSLLLSGHTHGGQLFPFTWLTRRVFGNFTKGLHQYGKLAVYTSTGAGTWGPPMRVGSSSEIVLLRFEQAENAQ